MSFYRSYHGAHVRRDDADRRSAPLGRGARHAGRRPRPQSVPRRPARLGHDRGRARAHRGDDRARRAEDDRRVLPRAGRRHQRRPRAARRLPPGHPRSVHEVRDPDGRRRSDVGLRPHRRMVRRRPLARRPRPDHDGEGADERVRAARRRRHAPRDRGSLQRQGVLRRPDLQQPSARLRDRARDAAGLRGRQPVRERPPHGRGDEGPDGRPCRRSTRSSAPSARSASSASSSS